MPLSLEKSYGNNLGSLAQIMPGWVKGTNNISSLTRQIYLQIDGKTSRTDVFSFVTDLKKTDLNHTRLTVGGNIVNYLRDCGTPTADRLNVKLLLNSKISTPEAHFMTLGIKDFYLMKPMERYKYTQLNFSDLPEEVIKQYNLR